MSELKPKFSVIVVAGGDSPEREISRQSGAAVAEALKSREYRVSVVDPADTPLKALPWAKPCLVFNALHGPYGEDGQLQADLDELGIPYTGTDARSSWLAFHKSEAKALFTKVGLSTPAVRVFASDALDDEAHAAAMDLGYPVVVKPEAQGSSLGVTIIDSASEMDAALKVARNFDSKVLIERAVVGEEWTVPVFDDVCLPPIRITSQQKFFDYSAKYVDDQTTYEVVTIMESLTAARVADLALAACHSLGCRGMCRVDLMVDGDGQPWLLEVNTSPGMTDHSLVPKSAASLGWSMGELCERILFAALPRFANL